MAEVRLHGEVCPTPHRGRNAARRNHLPGIGEPDARRAGNVVEEALPLKHEEDSRCQGKPGALCGRLRDYR